MEQTAGPSGSCALTAIGPNLSSSISSINLAINNGRIPVEWNYIPVAGCTVPQSARLGQKIVNLVHLETAILSVLDVMYNPAFLSRTYCGEIVANLLVHLLIGYFDDGLPPHPLTEKEIKQFFRSASGCLFRSKEQYLNTMRYYILATGANSENVKQPFFAERSNRQVPCSCPFCPGSRQVTVNAVMGCHSSFHILKPEDGIFCQKCGKNISYLSIPQRHAHTENHNVVPDANEGYSDILDQQHRPFQVNLFGQFKKGICS